MLDTTLSDAERYPLKLSDLIVMDVDREVAPVRVVWSSSPELARTDIPIVGFTGDRLFRPMYTAPEMEEYTGSVMTIDPSGRGADELGYAVTKMLRGMVYLRRAGGLTVGDGMFTNLLSPVLQRIYPCAVEEIRHSGQKERRIIDIMEPVLNQHRLVVDAGLLKADQQSKQHYQLFYQMTRLTRERGSLRHDDRIEAVSMGVKYWSDALQRDITKEEERRAEELEDAELEKFMQAVTGRAPSRPNFYDNY
jgi:hypothetical protein